MAKTRKPQDPKPKELLKVGGETFPGGIGELRLRCHAGTFSLAK